MKLVLYVETNSNPNEPVTKIVLVEKSMYAYTYIDQSQHKAYFYVTSEDKKGYNNPNFIDEIIKKGKVSSVGVTNNLSSQGGKHIRLKAEG